MVLNNVMTIVLYIILNLFDNYNETTILDCPLYCGVEHTHKVTDGPKDIISVSESTAGGD
mgnify:CR=1 FL=1